MQRQKEENIIALDPWVWDYCTPHAGSICDELALHPGGGGLGG